MAQRLLFSASTIHGPLLMNSKYDVQILIFVRTVCCISGLHHTLLEEMLYVTRALCNKCKIASQNIFIICEIVVLI